MISSNGISHDNAKFLSAEDILAEFDCSEALTFFVNGQRVDAPAVDPRQTLATFLREKCECHNSSFLLHILL
jgi:hypothetical protein